MISKIREMKLYKRHSFQILLAIEIILLLFGVSGLFGKNAIYQYGMKEMTINMGEYQEDLGGVYIENIGYAVNMVDFEHVALPKGTYRVQMHYVTDTDGLNSCTITDNTLNFKTLFTNGESLYSGLSTTDIEMWLLQDCSQMIVHASYAGEGMMAIRGLTIQQTNAWNRILLFVMICFFAVVNIIYVYKFYDKEYGISVKSKCIVFILGVIVLISSYPLMVDYITTSSDIAFHLMRVEGIRDGTLSGQFPVRISPKWQQDYGYASPIFYGETFLYIAAFFRLIGFSISTSYRLFLFVVTIAITLVSYYCYRKIFNNAYVGLFCSFLYTLASRRIFKTYIRGYLGECLAEMLLPIILYGFYRVFTQDIKEKTYKRSWIPLTIGFSLLIQTHWLTCELVGGFTVLLCIILWKRVFRKETFIVLTKTVIYSVLLSAWYIIPFIDYMLTGDFVIQNVYERKIQSMGLYLAQLFQTYAFSDGNIFFDSGGMKEAAPMGVGMALMVVLVVWGFFVFTHRTDRLKKEEHVLGHIMTIFAVMSMAMSLNIFPWDFLHQINIVTKVLVSSLQYPERFLIIATLCLVTLGGDNAKLLLEGNNSLWRTGYFSGIIILVFMGSVFLMNDLLNTHGFFRAYGSNSIGTGYISGGEYNPYGADTTQYIYRSPYGSENVTVEEYEKRMLGGEVYVINNGQESGNVAFPLLYYKGYMAYDKDTGERLRVYSGDNFVVTVEVPVEYKGYIVVAFKSLWYWRLGEVITLVSLLGMIVYAFVNRRLNRVGQFYREVDLHT